MSESVDEDFKSWLGNINSSNLAPDIVAFNFGIFESENGFEAYLTGSSEYDPEDDDWACREEYVPAEKYFRLPESLTTGKDWKGIQSETAGLVKRFLESEEGSHSFLAKAAVVTVGFDDGYLELVK